MSQHIGLMPGSPFPILEVPAVGGGTVSTKAEGKYKLVVIYRGHFCPFCRASNEHLISKKSALEAADIDVVAISADLEEHAAPYFKELGFNFPVGYNLTKAQMKELGVYISDPKDYQIHLNRVFSEPAWFFLRPDGVVKYIDVASMPMGGRLNVDNLLAGHAWVKEEIKTNPPFEQVVWGSVL